MLVLMNYAKMMGMMTQKTQETYVYYAMNPEQTTRYRTDVLCVGFGAYADCTGQDSAEVYVCDMRKILFNSDYPQAYHHFQS